MSIDLDEMAASEPIETGDEPRRVAELDGHLWVTNIGDDTVSVLNVQ